MSRQGTLRRGAAALALCLSRLARAGAGDEEAVDLPEVVVRVPRTEAAEDRTAAATVVQARQYAGEAKTVAELVATAPGVSVRDYGGLGQLATVSIRGSTSDDVLVLLDGMPLNTAAGGGVDLSSIPRQWIDRIEVVRGAEGAHYGSGALGGVVNVITRPAAAGSWSAEATGGSFLTFSASGDDAVGSDRWAAMGAAALDTTSGRFPYLFYDRPTLTGSAPEPRMRDNNGSRSAGGLFKGWTALGDGQLDALVQLSGGHRELPGWPYALTPDDFQDDARAAAVLRYRHPLGGGLHLSTQVSTRYDQLDLQLAALGPQQVRQRDLDATAQTELAWYHGPGVLTARASAGAERLSADGIATPHVRPELAVSLSEEVALLGGRLRFGPALRGDWLGPFSGLSGKLGGSYLLGGPLSVRASAGRTFRAPSFAELYLQQGILQPNPGLRSEEAWSADAALVADGRYGVASVGAFSALYQDLIVYLPSSFQRLKPFNDGKALAQGLEVQLASAPLRSLLGASAQLAYTLLDSQTLRGSADELGRELPYRPRHRLYARVGVEPGPFEVHAEAQYVGLQFMDTLDLRPVPAALTFAAGASVRLWSRPEVRADLEVRNLFDDLSLQDGFGNPLPGRMVLLTLRVGSQRKEG